MDDISDLFSGFKALSKEEWKSMAKADLKGESFERLLWNTYEGFDVEPFYTSEDTTRIDLPVATVKDDWATYQQISVDDVEEANKQALVAKSYDVHGLLFCIDKNVEIRTLLKGLKPTEVAISFSGKNVMQVARDYFEFLKEEDIDPAEVSGFCDYDILGQWITEDIDLDFEGLSELLKISSAAPNFKVMHISSEDFINAGSNFTQELAFTMNKVVEYIDQLTKSGFDVNEVVGNLHFGLSITGDFFFEIAKLRAFRTLAASVLHTYGIENPEIPVLALSSLWSKSRHDYHVNMIRNTSEAMSAILGGADATLIRAHNSMFESPTPFSQRIAVNISNLLRSESYLDKVNDPVAGTYYVQVITAKLAQRSLDLFKKTEKAGGLIPSVKAGNIQNQISEIRTKKEKDLLKEEFIMVGTNKYLAKEESLDGQAKESFSQGADGRELLFPRSLAEVQDTKTITK